MYDIYSFFHQTVFLHIEQIRIIVASKPILINVIAHESNKSKVVSQYAK